MESRLLSEFGKIQSFLIFIIIVLLPSNLVRKLFYSIRLHVVSARVCYGRVLCQKSVMTQGNVNCIVIRRLDSDTLSAVLIMSQYAFPEYYIVKDFP